MLRLTKFVNKNRFQQKLTYLNVILTEKVIRMKCLKTRFQLVILFNY